MNLTVSSIPTEITMRFGIDFEGKWLSLVVITVLLIVAQEPAYCQGPGPTFAKIADTQTAVPGGTGTFALFADSRAIEGGKVAFVGFDSGSGSGIYGYQAGALSVLVDTQTVVPGTANTFSTFFDVSIGGAFIAFTGGWPGPGGGCSFAGSEGLFGLRFSGGPVRAVATSLSTSKNCFHGLDFAGNAIAVAGGVNSVDVIHNHSESVMVARNINSLNVFLDTTTPSPSGGTFVGFDQDLAIEGNGILFTEIIPNTFGAVAGIYVLRNDGLGPRLVADQATQIPGSAGLFKNFAGADWDGTEVAFVGRNSGNASALYAGTMPSDLRVVVDNSTPVPGEVVNFGGLSNPIASEGGVIVFSGFWSGSRTGLFTEEAGVVSALLKKDDLLDGRAVDQAFCRHQNKDGNALLIEVRFQDQTRGLYLVNL